MAYGPDYATQVNYARLTRYLQEIGPGVGPARTLEPGAYWSGYRTFVLSAGGDRERRSLARRRFMRTVAPWVTENPLMMQVRWSDSESVRAAIDQCAEVGFEKVILTFGSCFNLEDDSGARSAASTGCAASMASTSAYLTKV